MSKKKGFSTDIIKKTDTQLIVYWECAGLGFGHLTMNWIEDKQVYVLEPENLGIDSVIEIFKALLNQTNKTY